MDQTLGLEQIWAEAVVEGFQSTLKLDEDSMETSEFVPALEWTHEPNAEEFKEGRMHCRVTTACPGKKRLHHPHLNRMVEIEPQKRKYQQFYTTGEHEQIRVTESDLRRFGNNLDMLRQCQIGREVDQECEDDALKLSFKSAFRKQCLAPHVDLRDPWKDIKNPEEYRQATEADLILNQAWQPQSPKKGELLEVAAGTKGKASGPPRVSSISSTRASSPRSPPDVRSASRSPPDARSDRSGSCGRNSSRGPSLPRPSCNREPRPMSRGRRVVHERGVSPNLARLGSPGWGVVCQRSAIGSPSASANPSLPPLPRGRSMRER